MSRAHRAWHPDRARTYRKARFRPPSARDVADANLEHALRGLADSPEQMYGRRKMTRYLRRHGHAAAFCTVDRFMRDLGMNGVVRGRRHRTTIPSKDGVLAGDRLNRDFGAQAPNLVSIADFTYVSTWTGWAYVAFVFDVFSRSIVGWIVSSTKTTALVSKALNMAIWRRDHYGHPIEPGLIHHSDAGSQSRLNRWMQHPRTRRVYGKAIGLDAGGHWTSADAVAGRSRFTTGRGAVVLGQDRRGHAPRRSRCRSGGIAGQGQPLVPRCWRDVTVLVAAAKRPLPVLY
ncbi:DDE-type integrase/transposase/recombinase [Nocardia salmonicida]|uniref:DDE-type integrase/transposase/recombinase n=1 Tax=Nocardia salmonicida TaxID=53431 RepID=UPI003676AB68